MDNQHKELFAGPFNARNAGPWLMLTRPAATVTPPSSSRLPALAASLPTTHRHLRTYPPLTTIIMDGFAFDWDPLVERQADFDHDLWVYEHLVDQFAMLLEEMLDRFDGRIDTARIYRMEACRGSLGAVQKADIEEPVGARGEAGLGERVGEQAIKD